MSISHQISGKVPNAAAALHSSSCEKRMSPPTRGAQHTNSFFLRTLDAKMLNAAPLLRALPLELGLLNHHLKNH